MPATAVPRPAPTWRASGIDEVDLPSRPASPSASTTSNSAGLAMPMPRPDTA